MQVSMKNPHGRPEGEDQHDRSLRRLEWHSKMALTPLFGSDWADFLGKTLILAGLAGRQGFEPR